jgi:hypothetical protein
LSVGWTCSAMQIGAGQVTFVAGSGATLNNSHTEFKTLAQYSWVSLRCDSNSSGSAAIVILGGDTSA